jgi:serine/threonine protein kinase
MAPETLKNYEYSTEADIWSLGVLLYEIFQGRAPW